MRILVTGAAGFIGFHLTNSLAQEGHEVIGLDNLYGFYDPSLKIARLHAAGFEIPANEGIWASSKLFASYRFIRLNLCNAPIVEELFQQESPEVVIHLAAQAGVRSSVEHPKQYVQDNVVAFLNILECCRQYKTRHLIYASSSSVYGLNRQIPFSENHPVDHPISMYAATKKSNELMAHTYSYLFGLPTTGLRFFTVYGAWGRPDMAYFIFTKRIMEGLPIQVYNYGNMSRDFTYIDDIVSGVLGVLNTAPSANPDRNHPFLPTESSAPFQVFNLGNNRPVNLLEFIEIIEEATGKKAIKHLLPMPNSDVETTFADIEKPQKTFGFTPQTDLKTGIWNFVNWYKKFYGY